MTALLRQTAIETKLFLRRKDELLWTLAFPIMFMVLFGLIYGSTTWAGMDMRSVDFLMPGIIVMGAMVTGIMRTSVGFVQEREKGIYRRLALTPLKRETLIGSHLLQHYVVIVIQTLLLVGVGVFAFNVKISGSPLLFWLILTVGALCFMSIGFALTGLMKTARTSTPVLQMTYFIMMFLGGVFFPNSMLPKFLEPVANALPSAQMSDALRQVLYQHAGIGNIWTNLVILAAWVVVAYLISLKVFRWE